MVKNNEKTTTVCVDSTDRDAINEFADRLNLSQRAMVRRLVETYRAWLEMENNTTGSGPPEDVIAALRDDMEKILKRDDRIVAFIREQEKVLLKPILQSVQTTESHIKLLNEILSNLE